MAVGARSASIIMHQEKRKEEPMLFRKVITDVEMWQQELTAAKERDVLLLTELHSSWCGPCQAIMPALTQLYHDAECEGTYDCEVTMACVDLDVFHKSLKEKEQALDWECGDDDAAPSRWSRIVLFWMSTVEPVFLFYRRGKFIAIVEGPNVPQIEFNLEWGTRSELDVATVRIVQTQKEVNKAVFTVQARWRRRRWMQKQGVFVDGKWMSHEEVKQLDEAKKKEREAREALLKRERAAIMIQKHIRAYLARRWFRQNKRQLLQRYRAQRRVRGEGDRRRSSVRRESVAGARRQSRRESQASTRPGNR